MRWRGWAVLGMAAVLGVFSGCGGGAAPPPAKAGDAKSALQQALDAWKGGKPPESLAEGSPKIEMTDADWKAGAALADFSISGEDKGQQGPQTFPTTLTIKGKPAKKVNYVVMITDAVRIMRDQDLAKALNPDNNAAKGKR